MRMTVRETGLGQVRRVIGLFLGLLALSHQSTGGADASLLQGPMGTETGSARTIPGSDTGTISTLPTKMVDGKESSDVSGQSASVRSLSEGRSDRILLGTGVEMTDGVDDHHLLHGTLLKRPPEDGPTTLFSLQDIFTNDPKNRDGDGFLAGSSDDVGSGATDNRGAGTTGTKSYLRGIQSNLDGRPSSSTASSGGETFAPQQIVQDTTEEGTTRPGSAMRNAEGDVAVDTNDNANIDSAADTLPPPNLFTGEASVLMNAQQEFDGHRSNTKTAEQAFNGQKVFFSGETAQTGCFVRRESGPCIPVPGNPFTIQPRGVPTTTAVPVPTLAPTPGECSIKEETKEI